MKPLITLFLPLAYATFLLLNSLLPVPTRPHGRFKFILCVFELSFL